VREREREESGKERERESFSGIRYDEKERKILYLLGSVIYVHRNKS